MRRALKIVLLTFGVFLAVCAIFIAWFTAEGKTNGVIVSSGAERHYLLYVPKSYDRSRPAPLVISFHPAASWPAAEMKITGWNQMAGERGFLVVYPSGSGFPRVWPEGRRSLDVDVRFISDLIDKLESEYNIDPHRIYADGISNGGGMAFALSCKLGDRIAAVGAVAAAQVLPWDWCLDGRPVPTIAFHGTADPVVPYGGGTSAISPRPFPAILDWTAHVGRRNHCTGEPAETRISPSIRRLAYGGCAANAEVVLYSVEGGGHTWPGGQPPFPEWIVGRTNGEVSATRMLWDFYSQHPLPQQ